MKFGSLLKESAEADPDVGSIYCYYKHLKKALKLCPPVGSAVPREATTADDASERNVSDTAAPSAQPYQQLRGASATLPRALPPAVSPCISGSAAARSDNEEEQLQQHRQDDHEAAGCSGREPEQEAGQQQQLERAEVEFVAALAADVPLLNDAFVDREETAIIRLQHLRDRADAAVAARDRARIEAALRDLVDFHGELLLLEHWGVLAYTALLKILKKHKKRTGHSLQLTGTLPPTQEADLANLLSQPFCSLEGVSAMARAAERGVRTLSSLLGIHSLPGASGACSNAISAIAAAAASPSGSGQLQLQGPSNAGAAEGVAAAEGAGEMPPPSSAPSRAGTAGAAAAAAFGVGSKRPREEERQQQPAAATGAAAAALPLPSSARAASASLRSSAVARQTAAALGLWDRLISTAHTPSTVLASHAPFGHPASSAGCSS